MIRRQEIPSSSPGNRGTPAVTGRHVLIAIVAFFVLVTGVNGIMIYKAVTTFGGLETPDAYRKGLAYNQRIALSEQQSQMGWRDIVEIVSDPARVRVSLLDQDGRALRDLKLSATISRPATNHFDAVLTLREAEPGAYESTISDLDPGSWIVNVHAFRAGEHESKVLYQTRRRLWLKP